MYLRCAREHTGTRGQARVRVHASTLHTQEIIHAATREVMARVCIREITYTRYVHSHTNCRNALTPCVRAHARAYACAPHVLRRALDSCNSLVNYGSMVDSWQQQPTRIGERHGFGDSTSYARKLSRGDRKTAFRSLAYGSKSSRA
jgi:hypothetical protein